MPTDHRLSGPDFLDSMADQSTAQGLEVNAAEFRQRAGDWRALEQRNEALEAELAALQRRLRTADDQVRILDDLRQRLLPANDQPHDPAASAA